MDTYLKAAIFFCFFLFCQPVQSPQLEPVVVITFDDGHSSIYNFAFQIMQRIDKSWSATHFIPVSYVGRPGYTSLSELKAMELAGWETAGHGFTHENLSSVPVESVYVQIEDSYDFLKSNGLSCESFSYPYGNYSNDVQSVAEKYFKNIRTSHDFLYTDGVNRKELGYFAVKSTYSSADIIQRVEQARQCDAPLVIIGFHAVIPDTAPAIQSYFTRESVFREFMQYLKDENLPVYSIKNAMEIILGK